jgi:hypothetical protein
MMEFGDHQLTQTFLSAFAQGGQPDSVKRARHSSIEYHEASIKITENVAGRFADAFAAGGKDFDGFSVSARTRDIRIAYQGKIIVRISLVGSPFRPPPEFGGPAMVSFDDPFLAIEHCPRISGPRLESDWNTIFTTVGCYCALKKAGVKVDLRDISVDAQ